MNENTARGEALPISIGNVTKTYGKVFALDDVSLEVESGEFKLADRRACDTIDPLTY